MSLSLCLVANILSAFIALDLIYFDSCHVIEEAITYILSYCKAYVDKQRQVTKKIRKILDRPFHSLEPREQEIGKLCGNVRILKFQSCKRVGRATFQFGDRNYAPLQTWRGYRVPAWICNAMRFFHRR